MLPVFSILLLGFVLGMRHATDPDHVVAVATIVSRERSIRSAALIGSLWGVGHTVTILLVGGAIVLFGLVIPPRVGLTMELSVAVMLVLLGALNLVSALRRIVAIASAHEHGHSHVEGHSHAGIDLALARADARLGRVRAYKIARPLIVGVVHGLAGSAAVALLVLGTIRDTRWAMSYLLVFGVGTIAGMLLITVALALPFAAAARRAERFHHALTFASGLVSVLFGLFLVHHIGYVDGLFTAHPTWTPG